MKILRNEPLSRHTSFRVGGPADLLLVPENLDELRQAVDLAREKKLPLTVIGAGTNLLALDKGFRGVVIKLAGGLKKISRRGQLVEVEAGLPLPLLLNYLMKQGLTGLEFLAGIPGTVGGAVVMNAGAFGKEIEQFIERVNLLDNKGKEKTVKRASLSFGYRKSSFQNGKQIVTSVVLRLRRSRPKLIKQRLLEFQNKRKEKQPLGVPNAGSIFKNPPGKFAGKILEAAGCKGLRVGAAQVSEKHANFILNLGGARARDILRLITRMQQAAKIKLEPELKVMVKFPL